MAAANAAPAAAAPAAEQWALIGGRGQAAGCTCRARSKGERGTDKTRGGGDTRRERGVERRVAKATPRSGRPRPRQSGAASGQTRHVEERSRRASRARRGRQGRSHRGDRRGQCRRADGRPAAPQSIAGRGGPAAMAACASSIGGRGDALRLGRAGTGTGRGPRLALAISRPLRSTMVKLYSPMSCPLTPPAARPAAPRAAHETRCSPPPAAVTRDGCSQSLPRASLTTAEARGGGGRKLGPARLGARRVPLCALYRAVRREGRGAAPLSPGMQPSTGLRRVLSAHRLV